MGGQNNASTLIPAILGLGGNITGIAVKRPGLGQPLTQFSQQMQERQLEQQRLQQQAAQETVRREQTDRRLNLQEQQQQAYLQSLQENQKLHERGLQLKERGQEQYAQSLEQNREARKRELLLKEEHAQQAREKIKEEAKAKLNAQAAVIRLQNAGAYLHPQQRLILDSFLKVGKIKEASDYIQNNDIYARIRALQDQGKLDPNNFKQQVRGLYPEFNKAQMENFLPGAYNTFVKDPGWFREKKLIPQTPTQMPTDGWSMTKKTP